MNETAAVVVRLEGAYAWVEAAGPGHACGACASRDGCQSGRLGAVQDGILNAGGKQLLRLPNTIRARPGDAVVIRAADGMVLRAAWQAYGIPLLLALGGAVLAVELTGSEPLAVIAVLFGLGGGALFMRRQGLESGEVEPILSLDFQHSSNLIVRGPKS